MPDSFCNVALYGFVFLYIFENLYSPSKHSRTVNDINQMKTKQLQSGQKHLKLNLNLDTRLAHNTLGRANPKYS